MKINEKLNKYLPSRNFALLMGVSLAVIGIVFAFSFISSRGESLADEGKRNLQALQIENKSVNELIQEDTDGDGITDWEEALWGTDKNNTRTFNETPDAIYIETRKKELNIEEQSASTAKLTETEKFAREFFTSFTALSASGAVDAGTINSFSNALGQKIVNPSLVDLYKETDVKIDLSSESNTRLGKQKYYENIKEIFQNYQKAGIGEELDIVNRGLIYSGEGSGEDPYKDLGKISSAYQDFANKIMTVSVPSELILYNLDIANSAHNTGVSVKNMQEIIRDPLVGLEGISQYQKYSEDLVKAVASLETVLGQ